MSKELNTLKQKQEFLEASWNDPDFEFDYDPKQGGFAYRGKEKKREEGEITDEPPAKRTRKDGEDRRE